MRTLRVSSVAALLALFAASLAFANFVTAQECPSNWHRFEDSCYFVNLTSVHSKYNKDLCDALNATMVSVHSPAQNEFLRRLLFIHYDSHKWVWLSRARNFNQSHGFLWLDSSPFNYSNWVAPEVDCSVCCEISLMASGHWYGSNCNTWTFTQLCQKRLESSGSELSEPSGAASPTQLDDNFFLAQFGQDSANEQDIRPNVSELVEWLAYEVESVREELHELNSTSRVIIEETMYERDSYLLTLLSLTVTLLLLILVSVILSYYLIVRKLRIMSSFYNK